MVCLCCVIIVSGATVCSEATDRANALPRATGRKCDNAGTHAELSVQATGGAALRRAGAVRVPGVAALQPGRAPGPRAGRAGAPHQRARPHPRHHPRRARRLPPHAPGRLAQTPRTAHRGGTRPPRRPHVAPLLLRLSQLLLHSFISFYDKVFNRDASDNDISAI